MSNRLVKTITGDTVFDSVRIYRDSDNQEYCCKLSLDNKYQPDADYFTEDKLDAISTAYQMLVRAGKANLMVAMLNQMKKVGQ